MTAVLSALRPRVGVARLLSIALVCAAMALGFNTAPAQAGAPQTLSGVVTDAGSGNPLEGIGVEVYVESDPSWGDPYWYEFNSTKTAADGTYVLPLGVRTYHVRFVTDNGKYNTFYGGTSAKNATDVEISAGSDGPEVNIALTANGTLSGVVRDRAGHPVEDIYVRSYERFGTADDEDYWWDTYSGAYTDEDGSYTVYVPDGTWRLGFEREGWVTSYYGGEQAFEDATEITMVSHGNRAGLNQTVLAFASIRGTVTTPNSEPISNEEVALLRWDPEFGRTGSWEIETRSRTDDDGRYQLEARPGTYRVRLSHSNKYGATYYGGVSIDTATDLRLTSDADISGINGVLRPISAPVNDNFAAAIALTGALPITARGTNFAATVEADEPVNGTSGSLSVWWGWTAPRDATVMVDTLGSDFDTTLGVYTAASPNPAVDDLDTVDTNDDTYGVQSAVTFDATAGTTYYFSVAGYSSSVGVITLHLSAFGQITGTVIDRAGEPIEGISVAAYQLATGSDAREDYVEQFDTRTDSDGTYSVKVPTGRFTVEFSDNSGNFSTQFYDRARVWSKARPVTLTNAGSLAGINATLERNSAITGRVTSPSGNPQGYIDVKAYAYDTATKSWDAVASVTSDSEDGSYRLPVSAGTYRVGFSDASGSLASTFYGNSASVGSASDIAVSDDDSTSGVDVKLALGARVAGVVTSQATGAAIPNAQVILIGHGTEWSVRASKKGKYSLGGLPAGSYQVRFAGASATDFKAEYWENQPTLATAQRVTLVGGKKSTFNAALANPTSAVSPVKPTPPAIHLIKAPKVGKLVKGKKVKVTIKAPAGAKVTYRWVLTPKKKKGKKAPKAKAVGSKSSLKPKKSWKGGKLKVVITVTQPGHRTYTKTLSVKGTIK